jgi:hypothetical protein
MKGQHKVTWRHVASGEEKPADEAELEATLKKSENRDGGFSTCCIKRKTPPIRAGLPARWRFAQGLISIGLSVRS